MAFMPPLSSSDSFASDSSYSENCITRSETLLSSSSSGISTPATARSVLFGFSQDGLPTNEAADSFILVVGGLGYIGSHTSWELLKSGQNVIIVDNLDNSTLGILDKIRHLRDTHYRGRPRASRPILDYYQVDYRDTSLMRPILQKYTNISNSCSETFSIMSVSASTSLIGGVIHFAAHKAVAESFQKPLSYYSNNVSGLVTFCTLLSSLSIKTLIFSSSATVYGTLANTQPLLREPQVDSSGCQGLTNPYGRTKWMCEAILSDLCVSDSEWTVVALRYFNPIGCDESGILGENPNGANLMPWIVKAVKGEIPHLSINGTDWNTSYGTAVRDFIHVSDLALGHLAALRAAKPAAGFDVFNLGTGKGSSVNELVAGMEAASGRQITTKDCPRREGDVGSCIAEPSKSAEKLRWKTKKTLREAAFDVCRYIGYLPETSTTVISI